MARNIKKETEWRNKNYKRLEIKVKKDKAERFTTILKEKNQSVNRLGKC